MRGRSRTGEDKYCFKRQIYVSPILLSTAFYLIIFFTLVTMQGENERDISSKTPVTKKFLEVSHCNPAKQRQRNVQKKCVARAKLLFFAN